MRDGVRQNHRGVLVVATSPAPVDPFAELRRYTHLDTRTGRDAELEASLPDASPEQLTSAARHAQGVALRLVRAELAHRGLSIIPLPHR